MNCIRTPLPVEEVVKSLIDAIESENMRLVTHINGQANAAKMGKTVPADQILEVFRPDFAIRVWQAYKPAGIDIPLRIHIYENGDGTITVAYREARSIFGPYNVGGLMPIAEELDNVFHKILTSVETLHAEIANG